MERDARRFAARRQELMQSGLSLGLTNSPPAAAVNNVNNQESGPTAEGLVFAVGNGALNSRYEDRSYGGFGDEGDLGLKLNSLRREMDGVTAHDSRVGTSGRFLLDARVEGTRAFPSMSPIPGDSIAGVSIPLFREGPSIQQMQQQRLSSPGGQILNFHQNNNHNREEPYKGLMKEASPGSALGSFIALAPTGNSGQPSTKPSSLTLLQTPPQGVVPAPGSAHYQALQQQALHQQTLHTQQYGFQLGLHQLSPQQQVAIQASMFKGGLSPPQSSLSRHMAMPQFLTSRPPQHNQAMKLEPMEREPTPPVRRSSPFDWASPTDQASAMDAGSTVDRASRCQSERSVLHRETPETSNVQQKREANEEGSKVSGSPRESKDSGGRVSGGRSSRGVFADLNAEPPVSDGEEEGAAPSDGLPPVAQPESSRTTPDEKKGRKSNKEPKIATEGDEELKKAGKPARSPAKSKGELAFDAGLDADSESHLVGVPSTHEEKMKCLKAGLIQVARKLPKNAHAQFVLGLMHQRMGEHSKAVAAFKKAAEVLKQAEEEIGNTRHQMLEVVQNHISQCLLQINGGNRGSQGKELEDEELEGVVSKLQEVRLSEFGQASVWNTLGLSLLRTGRIKSAIRVLTSLLEVAPAHLDALGNLGVAYLHSGELERATRCFQAVLDKDQNHPGALVNYSALLLRQYGSTSAGTGAGAGRGHKGHAREMAAATLAQQCLQAALKEDASATQAWANLAAAYSVSSDMGIASRCLEQAIKSEPSSMSARFAVAAHRVRDAERSEDPSEQLSWAANEMASILREKELATIEPRLAWAGLAMVNCAQHEQAASFEGGDVDVKEVEDRALQTLQQAIVEDPEDGLQWHQLGLHTLRTLQFGLAQNYFKAAIARRNTCPLSWSNLGIALQLSEDPLSAEGVYKKALHFAPPEQAHSIYSNLGNLYRQQRRNSEAHTAYVKALELCPEYAPACNNLGLLYITEDRFDEAISSFDRALAADPHLDAAKSNRMKAVALAQTRKGSGTLPSNPSPASPPPLQGQATVQASEAPPSLEGAPPATPPPPSVKECPLIPQTEPFPLPSIS